MSSEATARRLYEQLGDRDKRAVDAWRGLGNDMATSLLNARALTGGPVRVPADDPFEVARRRLGLDPDVRFRATCEHEAAHAVVVRHLPGMVLHEVEARADSTGDTWFEGGTDQQKAAVYAAADVWMHDMRAHVLPDDRVGCRNDRHTLIRLCRGEPYELERATRLAYRTLADNYDEVLAFAEMLGEAGKLAFGR